MVEKLLLFLKELQVFISANSFLFLVIFSILVLVTLVKFAKKLSKAVILVILACWLFVSLGLASLEDVKRASDLLKDKATKASVEGIALVSDTVRVKGAIIEINVKGNWINFDDILGIKTESGKYVIDYKSDNGLETTIVEDTDTSRLLDLLSDDN